MPRRLDAPRPASCAVAALVANTLLHACEAVSSPPVGFLERVQRRYAAACTTTAPPPPTPGPHCRGAHEFIERNFRPHYDSLDRVLLVDWGTATMNGVGNTLCRWQWPLEFGLATNRAVFFARDPAKFHYGDFFHAGGFAPEFSWVWSHENPPLPDDAFDLTLYCSMKQRGFFRLDAQGAPVRHGTTETIWDLLTQDAEVAAAARVRIVVPTPDTDPIREGQPKLGWSTERYFDVAKALWAGDEPLVGLKDARGETMCSGSYSQGGARACVFSYMFTPSPRLLAGLAPALPVLSGTRTLVSVHIRTGFADDAWKIPLPDDRGVARPAASGASTDGGAAGVEGEEDAVPAKRALVLLGAMYHACADLPARGGAPPPCVRYSPQQLEVLRNVDAYCAAAPESVQAPPALPRLLREGLPQAANASAPPPLQPLLAMLRCAARLAAGLEAALPAEEEGPAPLLPASHKPGWALHAAGDVPRLGAMIEHALDLHGQVVSLDHLWHGHVEVSGLCDMAPDARTRRLRNATVLFHLDDLPGVLCGSVPDPRGSWTRSMADFFVMSAADVVVEIGISTFPGSTRNRAGTCGAMLNEQEIVDLAGGDRWNAVGEQPMLKDQYVVRRMGAIEHFFTAAGSPPAGAERHAHR